MNPTPDHLVGRLLDGRYQLGLKLGEGGMGAVYRATHTLMGKACAIKVLRGPAPVVRQAAKRFQREAQSASRLDHDHCIRVTDFGITNDELMYLVMELLEGRSLADELSAAGAFPLDRLLHIATQVAAALVHAHALGIVHRDLKPDNIFLIKRGGDPDFVKVLDFGLAKILDDRSDRKLSALSEAGSVFGTPEYMAPEQAEGKPLDHRADLYSFGVVLYHMMTGQLPFQGATLVAILTKHLHERPMSPALRRPDLELPRALVDLCLCCLEKAPDARPASADEALAVLQALVPATSTTPPPPRVPSQVASHPTVDIGSPVPAAKPSLAAVELVNGLVNDDFEIPRHRRTGLYAVVLLPVVVAIGIVVLVYLRAEAPPQQPPPTAQAEAAAKTQPPAPPPSEGPSEVKDPAPPPIEPDPRVPPVTARAATLAATHLRAAEAYAAKGNHLKELYHLQEAVHLAPANAEALFLFGRALLDDGDDRACPLLARARNLGNKSAESLYQSSTCKAIPAH